MPVAAGGEFWLKLDRQHHTVVECNDPADCPERRAEDSERGRREVRASVIRDAEALRAVLASRPGGYGTRELRAALRGAGHGWGRDRSDAALAALEAGVDGVRLVDRGEDRGKRHFPKWVLESTEVGHE